MALSCERRVDGLPRPLGLKAARQLLRLGIRQLMLTKKQSLPQLQQLQLCLRQLRRTYPTRLEEASQLLQPKLVNLNGLAIGRDQRAKQADGSGQRSRVLN